MNALRLNIADDINRFHNLACKKADEAMSYAAQAGNLLLEVKASLKHGEWMPWLAANVSVSHRMAQRYMQAARGRPFSVQKPKAKAIPKPLEGLHSLRDDGRVAVDYPARKVIAYPNASGCVVLMLEEDGKRSFTMIEPEEVPSLCIALERAAKEAKPISDAIQAEYGTFQAIENAKGGVA